MIYKIIMAMVNIYNRTHKDTLSVSTICEDNFFVELKDIEESLPFDDDIVI